MTTPKKSTKCQRYNRPKLAKLSWGLLFHMLGLSKEAIDCFNEVAPTGKKLKGINAALSNLADQVREFDLAEGTKRRSKRLLEIARKVDHTIHPEKIDARRPRLNKECERCSDHRQARDGEGDGYSRDPFKKIPQKHKPEIALAAILYLARAHSLFFCRTRAERDFNAAKISLNDLFQANQLACRLYYSLKDCHLEKDSQGDYFEIVKQGPDPESEPWSSPFYVWSLLQMVEIQRGNIYRQIKYSEEADNHYHHAQKRFEQLTEDPLALNAHALVDSDRNDSSHQPPDYWLATPTLIRAFFERSKILFDRGRFIESMMNQIRCLALLVRMAPRRNTLLSKERQRTLGKISRALRFLDVVRKESVWDKEKILLVFGFPEKNSSALLDILFKDKFLSWLRGYTRANRELVTELFARIGFTLFILRRKQEPIGRWTADQKRRADDDRRLFFGWLSQFFEIHRRLDVSQSPLGRYSTTIIIAGDDCDAQPEAMDVVFDESLERELARRLRDRIGGKKFSGELLSEVQFYEAALEITTQNIINIVTIPRRIQGFFLRSGYKHRRTRGDLSKDSVAESANSNRRAPGRALSESKTRNKLVILRRWQSFNPRIPRPLGQRVRGGGYFLLWQGKGIAIDPGYDFIQNFYDEGFSLDDIDAVMVTHSHPDHEDDLSTLTTLVREWNEYHKHMGSHEDRLAKLDLFLNESAHLKFSAWLKASQVGIGRVVPLPLVVWNALSEEPEEELRGDNVIMNLRKKYRLDLEVVPAWHDDVIGKTAAIGLKFHLYSSENGGRKAGLMGYTGDTGAYPWPENMAGAPSPHLRVEDQYEDCDVLIAHLGDIRLRELFTSMQAADERSGVAECVNQLLTSWFCDSSSGQILKDNVTEERVKDFFSLLVTLHIAPTGALEAILDDSKAPAKTVSGVLSDFIEGEELGLRGIRNLKDLKQTIVKLLPGNPPPREQLLFEDLFLRHLTEIASKSGGAELKEWQIPYALLGFLVSASRTTWRYRYHLGVSGLYRLHRSMIRSCEDREKRGHAKRDRVLIVGELPEELASYRHHVARLLNVTEGNVDRDGKKRVHSFTGDIGLHISLGTAEDSFDPKIRCTYCNYNNETLLKRNNYHSPEKILETALKRLDSAMIYLCTKHDHHPEAEEKPYDFLSRPNLRVI